MANYITKLAQATKPCPCLTALAHEVCPECLADGGHSHDCRHCPHGSGKVALVPGLTRTCANEDGVIREILSEAEALAAMWECARNNNWQVLRGIVTTALAKIDVMGDGSIVGEVVGEVKGTDPEALAEALVKALGLVK